MRAFVLPVVIAALLILPAPGEVAADPFAPVTVTAAPLDQGPIFSPEVRAVADLDPQAAMVEEEYFVSGAATVYTYNDPPVRGEIIPLDPDLPYTTRIIVRRPTDSARFNGTVVIEWWNSTAGWDTSPVWDASAEYFARKGIVYVGVTNSTTSLDYLVDGCPLLGVSLLGDTCGTRYAGLVMTENGQAFEMVSQIANLLKSASSENPLHPDYAVQRIFHAGQSQQGGSMVTYASAFHFPVNDGYFIQAAGGARPINFGPVCGEPGSPAYPGCTPALTGDQRLVRTDLPVPVYRAMTGTDVASLIAGSSFAVARQTDILNFRYYEMPGTAHVTVHKNVEILPAVAANLLGLGPGPLFLEDACSEPLNTLADGPMFGSYLYNAMWENMELHARFGTDPPHGELIEVADGAIVTDAFGNARGGIRLPLLDVPIATYGVSNSAAPDLPASLAALGNLFCIRSGTVTPFDLQTLETLYEGGDDFAAQTKQRIEALMTAGFLLAEDAAKLRVPQTRGQQKCINALLKGGGTVAAAQSKLAATCVASAGKGRVDDVDVCLSSDVKNKIIAASDKADKLAQKACSVTPDFAQADSAAVIAAAISGEAGLIYDIFGQQPDTGGGPLVDDHIIRAAADKAGAKCQAVVAKFSGKIVKTKLKVFGKCAKDGLKGPKGGTPIIDAVGNAGELGECLGADPSGKISKVMAKLRKVLGKKCLGVDRVNAFPGNCQDSGGFSELAACLESQIDARVAAVYAWIGY
ncbi:MAG: alpha/beta hydrolase domain-containing protein [Candidatus Krumholzibacteriia bacterium]